MKVLNQKCSLDKFFDTLKKATRSTLILDYDGTLAPFSTNRMDVKIYPQILPILQKLVQNPKIRVIVISGRALDNLEKLLPFYDRIEVWGSHGIERKTKDGKIERAIEEDDSLREVLNQAKKICQKENQEGKCELKPFGLALHWRGLSDDEINAVKTKMLPRWEKLIAHTSLEIHPFDNGVELRPKGKNKGKAVQVILSETDVKTPIAYLGDDRTDEEAFLMLSDRALKVLVKSVPQETVADIQLIPPDELREFLETWLIKS